MVTYSGYAVHPRVANINLNNEFNTLNAMKTNMTDHNGSDTMTGRRECTWVPIIPLAPSWQVICLNMMSRSRGIR